MRAAPSFPTELPKVEGARLARQQGAATIARLNDELRRNLATGDVMLTAGIRALPPAQLRAVLACVRRHDDFTPDNDPNGERDFCALELEGPGRIFWKIDYYDPTLTFGSENPADPTRTRRVLTIMLAEE
ncbi:DUF3768 domain-containing protein [Ancylobacter vacuolatus]|uniref:DUF3768 domain-containing protein n=1 Tax=Ancylobacter vacuolatus TaxID=223389 RepID=UPI0036456BE7